MVGGVLQVYPSLVQFSKGLTRSLEHYTHKTRNEQSLDSPYGLNFGNLKKLKRGFSRQMVLESTVMKMNEVTVITVTPS
jgi:hypothetical protein